jgi:N-acetyl-gamma-glutamyl-phosphate reductase/acetylglutamate kinase
MPVIFGVSGYSGAGSKPNARNNLEVLKDAIIPYSLVDHVHEREISHHLNHKVAFMPHVAG